MNNHEIKTKIEPVLDETGRYCLCGVCGYYELIPIEHSCCPYCKQPINWDWYEKMLIKR